MCVMCDVLCIVECLECVHSSQAEEELREASEREREELQQRKKEVNCN